MCVWYMYFLCVLFYFYIRFIWENTLGQNQDKIQKNKAWFKFFNIYM